MDKNSESVEKIADELKTVVSAIVQIPSNTIDSDKNIATLGLNSLTILILLQKINEKFKIKLKIEDLTEYTSINSLANFIKNLSH